MPIAQTRRRFLNTLSLAGVVGLLGARPALAGEGALETTTQLTAVPEGTLRTRGYRSIGKKRRLSWEKSGCVESQISASG